MIYCFEELPEFYNFVGWYSVSSMEGAAWRTVFERLIFIITNDDTLNVSIVQLFDFIQFIQEL